MPDNIVFDIERYATEDGPGIRTVVFFKGCNLRCSWCQNPESHIREPQIMYYRNNCVECGRCVESCSSGAITNHPVFGFVTDHEKCNLCGSCIDVCYTDARKVVGRSMTIEEIMSEIMKDLSYYSESGGGVTFSGGEPLLYPETVSILAQRCQDAGIHTALETAGSVPQGSFDTVLPFIDLVYFDLKHIDSEIHQKHTGMPLDSILPNIGRVSNHSGRMIVRIPVVPGFNNDSDTLKLMFSYLRDETSVQEVELLPFHRLGQPKYEGLGLNYSMADTANLGVSDCEVYAESGRALGLTVRVGGSGG